ncbi:MULTISPECIES: hypothetical protein [Flavobacterium]
MENIREELENSTVWNASTLGNLNCRMSLAQNI